MTARSPWHGVSPRWGHPWHGMCSYLGTFPPVVARVMIEALSEPGEIVLDPFCGRGTTLLESRLAGRIGVANDLNPLAAAIAGAKNVSVRLENATERVSELERRFELATYLPEASAQSGEINLIYHPHTLAQLCYLRRRLLSSKTAIDRLLIGAILGLMHGNERQDGSSSYLSISMPNTFSMAPEYVRKFVAERRLQRVERNVFQALRDKLLRLFRTGGCAGPEGVVTCADAKALGSVPELEPFRGKVRFVLGSPPYLNIVNYAKQNWIRLWFLRADVQEAHNALDDDLLMQPWLNFMNRVIDGLSELLSPGGTMVFVIGDVVRASRGALSPARELIRHLSQSQRFRFIGCLSDHFEIDDKTTRIWGDTKGQATTVDRVVVLSDTRPRFNNDQVRAALADVRASEAGGDLSADGLEAGAEHFAHLKIAAQESGGDEAATAD